MVSSGFGERTQSALYSAFMSMKLSLHQMTTREKLAAMEAFWEDFFIVVTATFRLVGWRGLLREGHLLSKTRRIDYLRRTGG